MTNGLQRDITQSPFSTRSIGDWFESSGWLNNLVEANITTSGRIQSMLENGHVTRQGWTHQSTAASINV